MDNSILDAPETEELPRNLYFWQVADRLLRNCFFLGPFSWFVLLAVGALLGKRPFFPNSEKRTLFLMGIIVSGLVCFVASMLVYFPIAIHLRKSKKTFEYGRALRIYLPVVGVLMLLFSVGVWLLVGPRRPDSFAIAFCLSAFLTAVVGLVLFLLAVKRLLHRPTTSSLEP